MYWFARLLVAATFLLLIAGGLVTSTGSGLAVPDWPLSYGSLTPPMVGGIRYEHTHRLIAATVGLLTLILTIWIGLRESRRGVRRLAIAAFGAVVLQGILGGLTVLWRLPAPVSIAHACLGPTFFVLVVLLATMYKAPYERGQTPYIGAAGLTAATIYLQLILGASLRHVGWAPGLVAAHIIGAVAVVASIAWLARTVFTQPAPPWVVRRTLWLAGLAVAQLALGLTTWLGHRPVWAATAHLAIGALLLAHAAGLAFHTCHLSLVTCRAFLDLTKPRLTLMAVLTTLAGFYLGSVGPLDGWRLCATLVGAALLGAGAGALNQYLERAQDARMPRTRGRPIPSGRLTPSAALIFGTALSLAGLGALWLVNALTALLGLATLATYLWLYTPLKTRTTLCTLVGAIPGALPPLMGWAAARGALDAGAWVLFALLFLWQLPHFLALAWLYRQEYAEAGFQMLPVLDPGGTLVGRQITLYCAALVPVSLLPTIIQMTGGLYFFSALAASACFFGVGTRAALVPTRVSARHLFLASLAYLPGLLALMALDKVV